MQNSPYIFLYIVSICLVVGCVDYKIDKKNVTNKLILPESKSFSLISNESNLSDNLDFNSLQLNQNLVEFIKEVLQNKPSWLAMLKKVKQAETKAGYKIDDSRPNMSTSIGWMHGKENTRESGFRTQNTPNIESRSKFNWEIDLWGKWNMESREAIERINAESYTRAAAKLVLIYETSRLWYKYSYISENIELIKKQIRSHHEAHVLHVYKYNAGLDDNVSIIHMENNIKDLVIEYNKYQSELSVCKIQLQTIVARPFDHNISNPVIFSDELIPRLPNVLPIQSLQKRPDVLKGLSNINAQSFHTKSTALNLYPSINLNLNAISMGGNFSEPFSQWKINGGPVFDIPIWDPKRKTSLDVNKQQLEIMQLEWKETILNAIKEIEIATINHYSAIKDLRISQNIQNESLKLLKISEIKFNTGLISKIELQNNQIHYEQTRRNTLFFKMRCFDTFFDLSKSLGLNWV